MDIDGHDLLRKEYGQCIFFSSKKLVVGTSTSKHIVKMTTGTYLAVLDDSTDLLFSYFLC